MTNFLIRVLSRNLSILLGCVSVSSSLATPSFAAVGDRLSVEVKVSRMRSAPRQFASAVADLQFGEELVELEELGDWFRVRREDGREGFVHRTSVTSRKVVIRSDPGLADENFTDTDVVLAGKGFAASIEEAYSAQAGDVNYAALDMLENARVPDSSVIEFAATGRLRLPDEQ